MPVEIRQLVVKANVKDQPREKSSSSRVSKDSKKRSKTQKTTGTVSRKKT